MNELGSGLGLGLSESKRATCIAGITVLHIERSPGDSTLLSPVQVPSASLSGIIYICS